MFLHQSRELGAEAARARGLMDDHAAAGLLHRCDDRVEIEGPEAPQVDDLAVHACFAHRGLRHPHHRAVGQHRKRAARPDNGGRFERNRVVTFGDLRERVAGPGDQRPLVVTVEGSVVDALRLQKDDRIVALDRRDQQSLGVVGVRRHHGAQPADVCEQRLRALTVRLPAVDAAAAGHADRDRRGEVAGRAIADPRRAGHDLIVAGIHVIGELDLRDGPQPVRAHADRGADDTALGDR